MNYNNPNLQQPIPTNQFPYGNNNMLLSNYGAVSQNLYSNQFLKCRPVSSKDEAKAYQIDLDGSLWVFTDLANGKIYTKQINNNGTATFQTYLLTQDQPYDSSGDYVTREEFNKVIQALMAAMPTQQSPADDGKNKAMNF